MTFEDAVGLKTVLQIGKTDELPLLWVRRKFNHVNACRALPFAVWKRKIEVT